jgi:hypothetical protein
VTRILDPANPPNYYPDQLLVGGETLVASIVNPPQVWPVPIPGTNPTQYYTDRIKIGPPGNYEAAILLFSSQGVTGPAGATGAGVTGPTGPKVLWPMFVFGA